MLVIAYIFHLDPAVHPLARLVLQYNVQFLLLRVHPPWMDPHLLPMLPYPLRNLFQPILPLITNLTHLRLLLFMQAPLNNPIQ